MLRKIGIVTILILFVSCAELQQVVDQLPQGTTLGNEEIGNGLRAALDKGIAKQVSKLTQTDGFYKNELVKILLPEELRKVDKTLRDIGLDNLADEGLRVLNRAAEDAVSEATPIFINAVYLTNVTQKQLYNKFNPVIKSSFEKVGADKIWSSLINKYNSIPLTNNVNPDLTDYVTSQALKGVYTMIAVEEKEIRTKVSSRTTDLLKKVFALQD